VCELVRYGRIGIREVRMFTNYWFMVIHQPSSLNPHPLQFRHRNQGTTSKYLGGNISYKCMHMHASQHNAELLSLRVKHDTQTEGTVPRGKCNGQHESHRVSLRPFHRPAELSRVELNLFDGPIRRQSQITQLHRII
jgi:hypothetical protein